MLVKNEIGCAPSGFEPWGAHRQRRIGILLNPRSGTNRSGFDACSQLLAQHKHIIHREVVTPGDVAAALVEMAAKQVDVLAVCGGDGTVQATLTALFHTKPFDARPPLALLAGGTTNMTAADVGIEGKPARALQRLLDWSAGSGSMGHIERRSVLRVDRGPDCTPFFGMFFSAAGIVQVTRARWDTRRRASSHMMRGALGTALMGGRYLLGLALGRRVVEPTSIAIRLDGQTFDPADYLALFITTLVRLSPGIYPYWGEEAGPLRYTAVAYQPRHLLLVAPSLLRGKRNRYLTPEFGYTSKNIHEAVLQLETECALDGQLFDRPRQHPLMITNGGEAEFLRL